MVINRSFKKKNSAISERVQWSSHLAHITVYITDIEVYDGRMIWASCH